MSRIGALADRMGFPRRLKAEDQERVLAGGAPPAQLGELAAFARSVKAAYVQPPPDGPAALAPRLAEAARAAAAGAATQPVPQVRATRRMPRRALAARVAFAVALLPALSAGLAVAGVKLPEPVDKAFDSVGVELPNQPDRDDGDAAGEPADAVAPSGEPVAPPPGVLPPGQARPNPGKEAPRGNGAQGRGKAIGRPDAPPGQSGERGKSGESNSGGNSGGNGKGASGGADPPGQANKPVTPPTPPPHSNAGGSGQGKPG
jgi:uncharacterized membrane protein YgcG